MAKDKATVLSGGIALQASGLPDVSSGEVPEWIQILPAGTIHTADGRGPYTVKDVDALIQASLDHAGGRLVLDENHATDAVSHGTPARAAGWMVALEERNSGIWAKVEWTEFGTELVAKKSYRGISPVITHSDEGEIGLILRAALTNDPNLLGMTALHNQNQLETETIMDLSALIKLLGLDQGATVEDVTAAIKKLADTKEPDGDEAAMQSALSDIAKKLGPDVKAESTAICAALDTALDMTTSKPMAAFTAMQSELAEIKSNIARNSAEAAVDAAIEEGVPGLLPSRDYFVSMHMQDPESTQAALDKMPRSLGSITAGKAAPQSAGKDGLTADDHAAIAALGVDPEAYKKTLAASAAQQEAL